MLPQGLGAVHRHVGIPDQLAAGEARCRGCHTDAGVDAQLLLTDLELLLERREEALSHHARLVLRG